jgi:hypothetical protein
LWPCFAYENLLINPGKKIRGPTSNSCEVGGPDAIFS